MERRVGEARWTAATRVAASGKWGAEFGTVPEFAQFLDFQKWYVNQLLYFEVDDHSDVVQ